MFLIEDAGLETFRPFEKLKNTCSVPTANMHRVPKWLERFHAAIKALEVHAEVCFLRGTKQQVFKFGSDAQSHSLLSRFVTLQRENSNSGEEGVLCAAVRELDYRLDVCHVTKGSYIENL
jgi:hypothetical protein